MQAEALSRITNSSLVGSGITVTLPPAAIELVARRVVEILVTEGRLAVLVDEEQARGENLLCYPSSVLVLLQKLQEAKELLQMSQHVRESREQLRVPLGAFIDQEQRRELTEIAQREDRSVSSIVRLALASYLEREREGEGAA